MARSKLLQCLYWVLLLTCPFAIADAFGGYYEIVKGKGAEICEAYRTNLNASNPPVHMLCEREIGLQPPGFRQPEWSRLGLWENRVLLRNIRNALDGLPDQEAISLQDEEWIKDREAIGGQNISPQLHAAMIDIDNDGVAENVLMYKNGICGFAVRTYATALLVQADETPRIDKNKTDLLMQNTWKNPRTGETQRNSVYYLYQMYGLFQYKGTTYFDKSDARPEGRDTLHVYRASRQGTVQVCEYRFTQ